MIRGWNDMQKGVEVRPAAFGNEVTICYNGLLTRSGADHVYLHCGFGNPNRWNSVTTQHMDHTAMGFEKTIQMKDSQMSFCFKDSANNWDNNSGHNWSVSY